MSEHRLAWCEKDGRQYFFLDGMPLLELPTPAHKFGNTIETIKAIRAVTGCALKDAKDIWDQRTRLHVAPNPTTCLGCAAKDALLEPLEPYLKDGETPTDCVKRNRAEVDLMLGLLAKEKARVETKDALLERARTAIEGLLPMAEICDCEECYPPTMVAKALLAELNQK